MKEELAKRRIPEPLANLYVKQVFLEDTVKPEKKLNGFAFANDEGGMEISIPNPEKGTCFKNSTRPKSITTIEGLEKSKASIFEGFGDFLSWLELHNYTHPPHTCYILNSNSFIDHLVVV